MARTCGRVQEASGRSVGPGSDVGARTVAGIVGTGARGVPSAGRAGGVKTGPVESSKPGVAAILLRRRSLALSAAELTASMFSGDWAFSASSVASTSCSVNRGVGTSGRSTMSSPPPQATRRSRDRTASRDALVRQAQGGGFLLLVEVALVGEPLQEPIGKTLSI